VCVAVLWADKKSNLPSGGLELLFKNQRKYQLNVPAVNPSTKAPTTIGYLVRHLADDLMADKRKELFVVNEVV
jgi:ubiquitin related modifier 1